MFVKGELYKQECGNGIKVRRLTKELKQVLEVIEVMWMDERKINAALFSIQQFKIAYRNEKLLSY